MSIAKQEFTDAGRAMLGRAQNGEVLNIMRIVVGSGAAAQPSDLWPLTQLINQEFDMPVSSQRDLGNGTLLVEGSFRSDQVAAAFDLHEVGVLAGIGPLDAIPEGQLYSVGNCFAEPPDHIDPAAPTVQVFKIKLIIDRIPSGNITVQIGPSEAVSGENVGADPDGAGVYKETLGNVLRFKRLAAGPHVDITEDVDENLITIGVKVVERDLDFYVPQTYPGITDPNSLFPTIQAALDSVADLIIPSNRLVTVHVYSGHFAGQTANITHPNGTQIRIVGLDVVLLTISGTITVAVAGAAPNYTVSVIVPSLAGIAVGDVVQIHNAPHGLLETSGYVVATRPTPSPTVDIRIRSNMAPASIAAGAAKLVLYPSQITTNAPAGATIFQTNYGVGLIKNFGIRNTLPTPLGRAFIMNGVCALEKIAVVGFDYGIGVRTGSTSLYPSICATQNNFGIQVAPYAGCTIGPPSAEGLNKTVFTGNIGHGIWIAGGSFQAGAGTYTYVNANSATGIRNDNGYWSSGNTPATTGGLVCAWNSTGIHSAILGITFTALDATNTVALNTLDCHATAGGQISIVHNVNTTGNYSPANGVLGPDGGYVSVQSP